MINSKERALKQRWLFQSIFLMLITCYFRSNRQQVHKHLSPQQIHVNNQALFRTSTLELPHGMILEREKMNRMNTEDNTMAFVYKVIVIAF